MAKTKKTTTRTASKKSTKANRTTARKSTKKKTSGNKKPTATKTNENKSAEKTTVETAAGELAVAAAPMNDVPEASPVEASPVEASSAEASSAVRRSTERRKVQRRRQIDPTTCERDYSDEEIAFMRAMDEYKRNSGRMFPTCSEILEVVRALGYVQQDAAIGSEWNPTLTCASTDSNDGSDESQPEIGPLGAPVVEYGASVIDSPVIDSTVIDSTVID
jgi:hypothetical protein